MAVRVFTGGGVLNSAASSFSVNAQSPMTLMAWVYAIDATAWSQTTSMVGVYGPGGAPSTAIQIGSRAGTGLNVWTWGGGILVNFTSHAPVAQWNHYAVTFNGTSAWTLYINGTQVATATVAQQAGNLTQTFINGHPTGGTNESGNFAVDDVLFASRLMSQDEIRTIYNVQGPRDGIFQNVIARYTYDEGVVGNPVVQCKDISATGANMTPSTGTSPVYYAPVAMCNVRRTP
jgi:hypothetical protein